MPVQRYDMEVIGDECGGLEAVRACNGGTGQWKRGASRGSRVMEEEKVYVHARTEHAHLFLLHQFARVVAASCPIWHCLASLRGDIARARFSVSALSSARECKTVLQQRNKRDTQQHSLHCRYCTWLFIYVYTKHL